MSNQFFSIYKFVKFPLQKEGFAFIFHRPKSHNRGHRGGKRKNYPRVLIKTRSSLKNHAFLRKGEEEEPEKM